LHRFAADKRYLSGVTMKQSTEVLRDVYLREVQYALFHFQMIEEGLKTYISEVHEVIQRSLPSEVVFRSDPKEYESAPLERLIKLFAKVTRNDDLVSRLKKLIRPRNHCAHRAYAHVGLLKVRPGVDMDAELRKIAESGSAAAEAFFDIQTELHGIASLKYRVPHPTMSSLFRK
jgi:hypothetical protein